MNPPAAWRRHAALVVAWRRHAALVAASKSALDLLSSSPAPDDEPDTSSPASLVPGLTATAADAALTALLLALDPASPKVAEPALECVTGLLTLRLLLGDVDAADASPVSKLFAAVLSCVSLGGGGDEALELAVLRVLVAFARCPGVSVSGECLGQVVKACYNVYLGSASSGNQLCAKLVSSTSTLSLPGLQFQRVTLVSLRLLCSSTPDILESMMRPLAAPLSNTSSSIKTFLSKRRYPRSRRQRFRSLPGGSTLASRTLPMGYGYGYGGYGSYRSTGVVPGEAGTSGVGVGTSGAEYEEEEDGDDDDDGGDDGE